MVFDLALNTAVSAFGHRTHNTPGGGVHHVFGFIVDKHVQDNGEQSGDASRKQLDREPLSNSAGSALHYTGVLSCSSIPNSFSAIHL
jgi:hypothetical protein